MEHNAINNDYKLGINQFSDLTSEEMSNYMGLVLPTELQDLELFSTQTKSEELPIIEQTSYPTALNWATKGKMTAVGN